MSTTPLQQQWKYKALRALARIHWLRGRDRVLRLFSNPDTQPSRPFETTVLGKPYTGNLKNFIDWTAFFYGAYSMEELKLLQALAEGLRARGKAVNVYDIGANIGHHTVFMSHFADRIYSFEPFVTVRNEMQRKLDYAGAKNVTVFPVALGDEQMAGSFAPPTGANLGTGTLGDLLPDNASKERIEVQVERGDDFFAAQQLPPVTLLKIDVEGYEIKALSGMKQTLWRDRPPMLLEIQQYAPGQSSELIDVLYPDHRLYAVRSSGDTFKLEPLREGDTVEALVLPAELAGIVAGS